MSCEIIYAQIFKKIYKSVYDDSEASSVANWTRMIVNVFSNQSLKLTEKVSN